MDDNYVIKGYKAFYKGLVNDYGRKFEIGKNYEVKEEHKKVGYHFCKNLEDVFVFYRNDDVEVCEVIGSGDIISYYNDHYAVYDVYASSKIKIIRKLEREEIIHHFLDMSSFSSEDILIRFITLFKLTEEEVNLFKEKYKKCRGIIDAISYYYEGDVKVYERRYKNG